MQMPTRMSGRRAWSPRSSSGLGSYPRPWSGLRGRLIARRRRDRGHDAVVHHPVVEVWVDVRGKDDCEVNGRYTEGRGFGFEAGLLAPAPTLKLAPVPGPFVQRDDEAPEWGEGEEEGGDLKCELAMYL